MMKKLNPVLFCFFVSLSFTGYGQQWPVSIAMQNGETVTMYKPQPSSFSNNELVFQSAVSIRSDSDEEPVFGMAWATADTRGTGNGDQVAISSLKISELRFPGSLKSGSSRMAEDALEAGLPYQSAVMTREEINSAIRMNQQKQALDQGFSKKVPSILYRSHATMLVLTDGDPIWQRKEEWGVEAVINSPNTIIKTGNDSYYIRGAQNWYRSSDLDGPYSYTNNVPANFRQIETSLAAAAKSEAAEQPEYTDETTDNPVEEIVVRSSPTELIQTNGKASFSPVAQTSLLYVENSPNDIFMDVNSQQYYILLAGRWFSSGNLQGGWQAIAANELPEDFARIPEGSVKDNVLSSVAGTEAAKDALLDAQVPQTARVNRKTATTNVSYDGEPEFESISGTHMAYARNSSISVLRYNRQYYLVDNGIWFQSYAPGGPWVASQYRPAEVDLIPPSYPVYSVKYVYIYDVTPNYIYTGYTPGYLNTFICGPTIVYGTGYYYRPWHRRYYYPRPFSWGFNMIYRPWYGWSFGINYSTGWYTGGWWGPARYRPAYCAPAYRNHGYYGYRSGPAVYSNNVYRSRSYVHTNNYRPVITPQRHYSNGPSRPQSQPDHRSNRPNPGQIQGSNGRGQVNNHPERDRPNRQYNPLPERGKTGPSRATPNRSQGNAGRGEGNAHSEGNGRSEAERAALYRNQFRQQAQRPERTERPQISERSPSRGPQQAPSRGQQPEVRRPERRGRG